MGDNIFTARDRAELQRVIDDNVNSDYFTVKLGFKTSKDEVLSMMHDICEMVYYEDKDLIHVAKVFFE